MEGHWKKKKTLHISTSKYYKYSQNRHDTVKQKLFARSRHATRHTIQFVAMVTWKLRNGNDKSHAYRIILIINRPCNLAPPPPHVMNKNHGFAIGPVRRPITMALRYTRYSQNCLGIFTGESEIELTCSPNKGNKKMMQISYYKTSCRNSN
jgi:hypothetical protein